MLRLILCSYDCVNISLFYGSCGIRQIWLQQYLFTATNKASNIAMSVPLFINFHKLKCLVIYNYQNLFNLGACKGVKRFGKQSRNYTVYSKNRDKSKSCTKMI